MGAACMDGGDVSAVLGYRSPGAGHRFSGPEPPGAVHRHQRAHQTPQVLVLLHVAPHRGRRWCSASLLSGPRYPDDAWPSGRAAPSRPACLAPELRIRSRLKAATVQPSSTVIFTCPNTRKNPRPRSTNVPFRAECADSMTWRRPMEIRPAVVPPGCAGKEPDQRGHGENPCAAPAPRGRVGAPEGPGRPNIKERSGTV